jgi:hypothetical protein
MELWDLDVRVNLLILISLLLVGNPGLVPKISKIFTVLDMSVPMIPISVSLLDLLEVVNH